MAQTLQEETGPERTEFTTCAANLGAPPVILALQEQSKKLCRPPVLAEPGKSTTIARTSRNVRFVPPGHSEILAKAKAKPAEQPHVATAFHQHGY